MQELFDSLRSRVGEPATDNVDDLAAIRLFEAALNSTPLHAQVSSRLAADEPPNLQRNTVGSHLYGCLHSQAALPSSCTPECVTGFVPPGLSLCSSAIFVKKRGGELTKIHESSSDDPNRQVYAYVFLYDGEHLTPREEADLFRRGFSLVGLYRSADGLDYTFEGEKELRPEAARPDSPPSSPGRKWPWLILFLLLLLGGGAVLYFLLSSPSRGKQEE